MAQCIDLESLSSPRARLFGERLRTRRLALGLTQADLHERTDIAVSYISHIERGHSNPTLTIMEVLSEAVGAELVAMLAM